MIVQPDQLEGGDVAITGCLHPGDVVRIDSMIAEADQLVQRSKMIAGRGESVEELQIDAMVPHPHQLADAGLRVLLRSQGIEVRVADIVDGQLELVGRRRTADAPPLQLGRKRRVGNERKTPLAAAVSHPTREVECAGIAPELETGRVTGRCQVAVSQAAELGQRHIAPRFAGGAQPVAAKVEPDLVGAQVRLERPRTAGGALGRERQ